jgi:hypothetical protein
MLVMVQDIDVLCEAYLKILFRDTNSSSVTSSISETYGEILPSGIDKLLSEICLCEDDVFYDFGSGLGKLAVQVFLKSDVKQVVGIELLPALHQQAVAAALKLKHDLPRFFDDNRNITFIVGSFLDAPSHDASVILLASPCFSPSLMQSVETLVNSLPNLRAVLTLRPMHGLKNLTYKKSIHIQCSWDAALCYLYVK